MLQADLNVIAREVSQKSKTRLLREKGFVPATIYGPGLSNETCAFSEKELRKAINNDFDTNFILNLVSDAKTLSGKKVILKSLERDPMNWDVIHADFYEVKMDRPITVSVPFHFTGVPEGVKSDGGILQVIRRSVRVKALASDIPQFIEVDITPLKLGTGFHVGDVKFSEKITILDSKDFALVSVTEPEKEEVVAVAATAEVAAGAGAATAAGTGTATAAGTAAPAADKAGAKPAAKPAGGDKGKAPAKK